MALPTLPTPASIVTESLTRKLNGGTPPSATITRAIDYGLEKVKRDIMNIGQTWRPLTKIVYDSTLDGVSKYENPSDLEEMQAVVLMKGDHSGTLAGVTDASRVYLSIAEDASAAQVEGRMLLITSGTGVDQAVQVYTYNPTSKLAIMAENFSTTPAGGDGYLICDEFKELGIEPPDRRNQCFRYTDQQEPSLCFPIDDDSYGYIELFPVPDKTYGLKKEYFADLRRIDVTSDLYLTKLMRRWAHILEQGVYVWALGEDDNRYATEFQIYTKMLQDLRARDGDLMNITDLTRQVMA